MPLDKALLNKCREGTADKLFYSIEPMQHSETEGRYLLVMHKDAIKEAELFIESVFSWMSNTPSEMAKIMLSNEPVRHANRIATSHHFQDYATKLQAMIPPMITTHVPMHNAWKHRTPTVMNLTDADFPMPQRNRDPIIPPQVMPPL